MLMGRSAPKPQSESVLQALREAGAELKLVQADVSKREEIASVLEEIQHSMPPLKGIFHAAGVLDDGILSQQTWERFAKVFAPKVDGGWHLHDLNSRHAT